MNALTVASTAFEDGSTIPKKYGYKNGNHSIPLDISKIPTNAKSITVIMDDPDAMQAVGKVWVHWLVWNITPKSDRLEIKEDIIPDGSIQGMTDFGQSKYGGPAPPDREHTYVFKVYALDCMLDCQSDSDKKHIESAIQGHILAQGRLTGRYSPVK